MKELLEKVAKAMPPNWRLELGDGRVAADFLLNEAEHVRDTYELGRRTDIGLSPLTALLKQSLGDKKDNMLAIHRCRYDLPNPPGEERDLWEVVKPHSGDFLHCATEFEAVAHAYLAHPQVQGGEGTE